MTDQPRDTSHGDDTEGHGYRWNVVPEESDTEGHGFRGPGIAPEDDDVEGHKFRWSAVPEDDDVEGHGPIGVDDNDHGRTRD